MALHAGWSEEGLYFLAPVTGQFDHPLFPQVTEGDSLELFIDTRDRKDSGFKTEFCHHFYFLPQAVEGHNRGEITRFRAEDAHPLADPDEIVFDRGFPPEEARMKFFLPAAVLVGWNPAEFKRIGLASGLTAIWRSRNTSRLKPPNLLSSRSPPCGPLAS